MLNKYRNDPLPWYITGYQHARLIHKVYLLAENYLTIRILLTILIASFLSGCKGKPRTLTLIHTQRVTDELCMVEISSPDVLRLDCLQIGPDGSTKLLWTEPFAPNPNGDENQFWVRMGEEIQVDRQKGNLTDNHTFKRVIPVEDLGNLDSFTQGFGSNSSFLDEPKIVWEAFYATDSEISLSPGAPGLWTEELLKDFAQDYWLNIIAIKVSRQPP